MAATMEVMDSRLKSVKTAVKSTTTCTTSTLASLQSLLQSTPPASEKTKANRRTPSSTSTKTVTRTKSTRSRNPPASSKSSKPATVIQDEEALSLQQRLVLATEVFNTASKALSDALQRNATLKAPLQPTSPNRSLSSPKDLSRKPTKPMTTVKGSSEDGLTSTAECAVLALMTLRNLKLENSSKSNNSNLQLEQGACILAGRLIALGAHELAYRELRALKKRLEEDNLRSSTKNSRDHSASDMKAGSGKETTAELLKFSNAEFPGPVLALIVSFQSHVLKLITAERKVLAIEKTCNALSTSSPSSPANIILRSFDAGNFTKEKAAIQLLSTSNTILSLSTMLLKSSVSPSDSTQTRSTRLHSTLRLQLVSMEYRIMSWELSGHSGDSKREFLDPLSRFLDGFASSDFNIDSSEFAELSATVQRLQSMIAKSGMKGDIHSWKIAFNLGKIAQEASCLKEALTYFSSATEKLTEEDPMAQSLIRCRIAIVYLHLFKNNKTYHLVIESLTAAALGMKSANRGSASDLEALLVESARLKKIAMAKIGELLSSDADFPKAMMMATIDFLHAFLRFLRRYINRPQSNLAEGDTGIQMQPLSNAKNIVIAAVESAIVLGKISIVNQFPIWGDLQPIFSDSARLLNTFEVSGLEHTEDGLDWRATSVKLSNLFWSRYLKRKESGDTHEQLIPLLEQSVNILQDCPVPQKSTGFSALKLERLAHLYLDAKMGAKSLVYFEKSIQEYIDAGVLEQQIAYLSGRPPHACLQDSNSPGFNLTRVLSAYLKMQLRRPANDNNSKFEGKSLDVEARAFLLEWQLGVLADFHSHDATCEKFKILFQELLSEMLSLYSSDEYLIFRLRVVRLVLRFVLDHPDSIETSVSESLIQDAQLHLSNLSSNTQHGPYAPFIANSLKLILLFHDGHVNEEDFRDTISFWASIIQECTNWESLESIIDDIDILLAQAQAASDFAEARGYWTLQFAASKVLLTIYEMQEIRDGSSLVLASSRCALQYCRHGDHRAARDLLERVKQRVKLADASRYAAITYQLAIAEINTEVNNTEMAEKALQAAQKLYRSKEAKVEVQSSRGQSKIAWERLIVDGTLLYSRLADQRKCLGVALYYAKLSVRLSTRLWTKLEHLAGRKKDSEKSGDMSDVDLVIDGVAKIDLSTTATSTTGSYAQGALFWKHVVSHNACFLNLMRLSSYNGLFQDAIYYGEQALKVNETLGTSFRLLTCQAELGLEWVRGNHLMEARTVLDAATKVSEGLINTVETVRLKISLAALSCSQGKHKEVLCLLREAEAMLNRIFEGRLDSSLDVKTSLAALEEKMASMKIRQASVRKEAEKVVTLQTRRTRATSKSKVEESSTRRVQVIPRSYVVLRNEIIKQQIHALLAIKDLDGASRLLETARDYSTSTATQFSIQIEETQHLLADAMKSIAAHAVYCVLPESTLSMPSIEAMISATTTPVGTSKPPVRRKGKSTTKELRELAAKAAKKEVDVAGIMSRARDAISNAVRDAVTTGSTVESHIASSLMGRVSMLSHATTPGLVDEDILAPVNANELGRITAFDRDRLSISIDKSLSGLSDPMSWPANVLSDFGEKSDIIANFTQDYVDILPSGWNVLSISLNTDRTEFIISRISHGRSPFLLRLPLKRSEEGNFDEDDFTFDWGKNEMKEIIRLANKSAHDAKSRTDKNSKKQWWATRESLDRRLETLLDNMENIWLGGFRGIFDAVPRDSTVLTQFAGSFEKVLNKHLPSRRRSKDKKGQIKIHENVLSLFIGLRDLDKQENPEDSVLDLLYFVVDILQFKGERNAYDEIDFDMMVIDTLDILNSFHCNSSSEKGTLDHMILILDKSLHSFPWESLPCLHGRPVSRMPSLACLRERIVRFRSLEDSYENVFEVNPHNGHFILNPSGDLKTTQSTFEEELAHREGWSSVIGRNPSEEEFKAGLENKDIFLYFGHGSGAQYIRGRTIKRLDKCAVAFLMGCSSGCLTEAGELEPYGTPMNYMQAGSPALVATLWDVTDKDIDRFAKSTFEQWGLLPGGEDGTDFKGKAVQGKETSKGREAMNAEMNYGLSNGLDEAVSRSRNSCLLKYLNGAAPVIYGIPVYLSK
ncbi:separin, putative [Talaromyces stipitatus ATCC 10500]|uniref:separase n=1 Tax=Talaromyces stipitatus (strain ATCC 10500 / CBS 375.48 / QM 6759 / NRRL 1006) TaxID=441959 RepID=B8MFN2_TALSN|nr:separin, putative [Talaromyces stipitatus ATCC 10500]EED17022.1 separin, putative [Talaromyces stipitatus ATCC 10500]